MPIINKTAAFADWFDALTDLAGKTSIAVRLPRLEMGNPRSTRSLGDRVHEIKVAHGPGYRIYFLIDYPGRDEVTLLWGGHKGTQARDIGRARRIAEALKEGSDG